MDTAPLPPIPVSQTLVTAAQIAVGIPITALNRMRIMGPQEWEMFILEYAHSLTSSYRSVTRHAGSGDMGCDVVAKVDDLTAGPWDNYQCKHYKDALMPSDIWTELGKLAYYTFRKDFTVPRAYYFVSPQGAGPELSKLCDKSDKLREGLLGNWEKYCKSKITSQVEIQMTVDLQRYIEGLDFSIIKVLSPLTVIDQHSRGPYHVARFGGGLKLRPVPAAPPAAIDTKESAYVRCLLDVYEESLGTAIAAISDLNDVKLSDHFKRARQEFYSAESLHEFSRDGVPPGTFENLLDEVYAGVIDVIQKMHPNAMERVLACVTQAKLMAFSSNPLVTVVTPTDKGGMCHQLANAGRVKWRT